ncbi:hypothetical protein Y032_0076g1019 [Ancylostoma ceylanicum]|uniref:Uncharacterized protein n=1 Tax=Ancylostoma ceylanicum TaxID=53326 RepID=A0A016TTI5_9BILA|nr:hypothetical protein Y032_0076g1019 [Ancylostoma ceylanicum]
MELPSTGSFAAHVKIGGIPEGRSCPRDDIMSSGTFIGCMYRFSKCRIQYLSISVAFIFCRRDTNLSYIFVCTNFELGDLET